MSMDQLIVLEDGVIVDDQGARIPEDALEHNLAVGNRRQVTLRTRTVASHWMAT